LLTFEALAGAVAACTAVEALVAWACRWLKAGMLWRGLVQIAIGVAAIVPALAGVPPDGDHGLTLFWAQILFFTGFLLALYGVRLTVAGWPVRPSALARLPAGLSQAERQAEAAQAASGGAAPAGRHDLSVAAGSLRIVLAVIMSLLALVGLGTVVITVLIGLTSSASNPQPPGPIAALGVAAFVLLIVSLAGAVFLFGMRCWLDGTTLHLVRPAGVKTADLAAVTGARLRRLAGVRFPRLELTGAGNLHSFYLAQWRGNRLLPPGELILLADALAANPRAAELSGVIGGLRELASLSVGHQSVREGPVAP
jgi:hypothetical protein